MAQKVRNYNRRYPSEYGIFRTIFYMSFFVSPTSVIFVQVNFKYAKKPT